MDVSISFPTAPTILTALVYPTVILIQEGRARLISSKTVKLGYAGYVYLSTKVTLSQ